jgi:hypothetical protein
LVHWNEAINKYFWCYPSISKYCFNIHLELLIITKQIQLFYWYRLFESGRSHWIFPGEKIHRMPSCGREVKPLVPCRRVMACKGPLNVTWTSGISGKIHRPFLALIPSFTNRGLSCRLTWSASRDDGWN